MANIFDIDNAPTTEPTRFTVGDFGRWKRPDLSATYPPADYTLRYIARFSKGGNDEINVVASNVDGVHVFTIESSESDDYDAGHYHWQLEVEQTSSGNRVVIQTGTVDIVEDLDGNNVDARTHAEIMVSKIESILQGKADSDVSSYSIAGRSLTKMSFAELTDVRDFYRKEMVKEQRLHDIRNGKTGQSTIKVRF